MTPATHASRPPPLTSPPLPAGTGAAAQDQSQAGFATAYQANMVAQSAGATGVVDGMGDAEITAAWVYRTDTLKPITGLTVAMPTGEYDAKNPISIGFGNFYTVRPGVAVACNASDAWTLGARASLGFNGRNKVNQIKSGNFGALDLAAAWRTAYGVVGPHLLHVQQYEDDNGGTLDANCFSATGLGGFYTAFLSSVGVGLNISYMQMIHSKNALSGSFTQIRASKAF